MRGKGTRGREGGLLNRAEVAAACHGFRELAWACGQYKAGYVWGAVCMLTRNEGGGFNGLLVGSSIFLIVPATQAASRLTMNSKPSLEIRVTNGEEVSDMVGSGCGTCTEQDSLIMESGACGAFSREHVTY